MTAQPPEPGTCRACGARLLWAVGANGKRNPLNAEPRSDGNIIIADDGYARYRSKSSWDDLPPGTPRYTSHFSDCPNASQFRRR